MIFKWFGKAEDDTLEVQVEVEDIPKSTYERLCEDNLKNSLRQARQRLVENSLQKISDPKKFDVFVKYSKENTDFGPFNQKEIDEKRELYEDLPFYNRSIYDRDSYYVGMGQLSADILVNAIVGMMEEQDEN